MSLLEELARLNDGLTPEDLLKVDEKRGIAEQTARWERINSARPSHSGEITGGPRISGKGSWFSQLPQYGWIDREDKPGSNALGVKDEEQGIALPSRKTLGQWFDVTFPNGETHRLQQTDVGPAQWTGKGIDISAAAAHKAGYKPDNFPTGGGFTWSPAEGPGGGKPPEETAATFDPTGRKQMANGDSQGILGALGMQNQQPQGLLGALGDPETMAYLGMMLKGLSPYSNIDPNSMLSSAHTNALRKEALRQQMAERATDNARADQRLDLDRQRFGLTQREYDEQRAQAERERQARENLLKGLPGATFVPDAATPDAPTPPSEVSKYDEIRKQIKYYEDNMGSLGQKDQIQAQKQIDVLKKRLEPSATELKQYDTSSGNLPQLESLKAGLERAKELVPQAAGNAITTYANKMAAWIGSRRPEVLATVELDRKMQELALTELKKLLPGPASNRDVDIIRGIASDPAMPPDEKSRRIGDVLTRVEAQIAKERGTVKRFQQKEGTYKPEEDAGGGLPGGWTVKVK